MSRYEPKNREEAFSYQFEDDVKVIHAAAQCGEKEFEQAIATLETHIAAYRNKNLRKLSERNRVKADIEHEKNKIRFPQLYK